MILWTLSISVSSLDDFPPLGLFTGLGRFKELAGLGIAHVHLSVWSLNVLVGGNIDAIFIQKGLEQGLLPLVKALPVDGCEIA